MNLQIVVGPMSDLLDGQGFEAYKASGGNEASMGMQIIEGEDNVVCTTPISHAQRDTLVAAGADEI